MLQNRSRESRIAREAYCARGAVLSLARRADVIHAAVQGSADEPYHVSIAHRRRGGVCAACDCPYAAEWDGWCKHLVAALLAVARDKQAVVDQPALRDLLAPLDRGQLVTLLRRLADARPEMYEEIAVLLPRVAPRSAARDSGHRAGASSEAGRDAAPDGL